MHGTKTQNGHLHIKLLLIILAVLIIGSAVFFLINRSAEPTAAGAGNGFASALAEQDAAASYDMLANDSKKQLTREDWEQWVQFIFSGYRGQKPRLVKESPINDPGNVYKTAERPTRLLYEFDLKDGKYTLPLVLVFQNNTWKIKEIGSFQE